MDIIKDAILESDIIVLSFPLYFFGMSSKMTTMLNRLLPLKMPYKGKLATEDNPIIMDFRYDSLSEELEKEKQLKLQQVEDKYSRLIIPPTTVESIANEQTGANNLGVTVTAKKPTKEQYAKYSAERLKIEAEYDEKILNLRQKFVDNRLEIVEKGSFKELQLQLQQNEISRQKEIAQNNQKKIEERQSEEDINAKYYKRAKILYGKYNIDRQQQINEFNKSELEAKKSSNARIEYEDIKGQIELWQLKIALAKQGALEMSEIEIGIAENTIKCIVLRFIK